MKLQIIGLEAQELKSYIRVHYPRIAIVQKKPDVMICYGGDGTLLYGERMHPGIPKLLLRNSQICPSCSQTVKDEVLDLLQKKEYSIEQFIKLEAQVRRKHLLALNDIVVAHSKVNGTLRARVVISGKPYGDAILGDGIVVSTSIGSTGYYQSITRSHFASGIGIAFNNTVNIVSHLVVDESAVVEVSVIRGEGVVAADNNEEYLSVSPADSVRIFTSKKKAHLVIFPDQYAKLNAASKDRVPLGFCQVCHQHYAP